jgi:hypothetical protein
MVKCTKRQFRQLKTALHWKIPEAGLQESGGAPTHGSGSGSGSHARNIEAVTEIGHKELKRTGAFPMPGLAKFMRVLVIACTVLGADRWGLARRFGMSSRRPKSSTGLVIIPSLSSFPPLSEHRLWV